MFVLPNEGKVGDVFCFRLRMLIFLGLRSAYSWEDVCNNSQCFAFGWLIYFAENILVKGTIWDCIVLLGFLRVRAYLYRILRRPKKGNQSELALRL